MLLLCFILRLELDEVLRSVASEWKNIFLQSNSEKFCPLAKLVAALPFRQKVLSEKRSSRHQPTTPHKRSSRGTEPQKDRKQANPHRNLPYPFGVLQQHHDGSRHKNQLGVTVQEQARIVSGEAFQEISEADEESRFDDPFSKFGGEARSRFGFIT